MTNSPTLKAARLSLALTAANFLSHSADAAEQLKNGNLPPASELNESSIKALIAGTDFVVREIKKDGTIELWSGNRFSKNFENDKERANQYVNSGSPAIIVEVQKGIFTVVKVPADHAYEANSATKGVIAKFVGKVSSANDLNIIERELARAIKEDIERLDRVNSKDPRAGNLSELVKGTGFRIAGKYFDKKDETKWATLLNNDSEFSSRFSGIYLDEIRRYFGAPFLSLKVGNDGMIGEITINAGRYNSKNVNASTLKDEFVGKPISPELLRKFSASAYDAVITELDKEFSFRSKK